MVCPNPRDGGSCLGPLAAGTYRTTVFETPFTFTVPEGWANYEDLPGNVLLVPPGSDILGVDANTSDFVGVYQGVAVEDSICQPRPEAGVGTSAEAMAAALASRPGIIVSDPVPVEVGGLSGLVIDIVTDSSSDAGCHLPDFPFPIVPLFIGMGPASLEHSQWGDGFTTRLYLLDRGDTNVVIEVWMSRARRGRRTNTSLSSIPSCFRLRSGIPLPARLDGLLREPQTRESPSRCSVEPGADPGYIHK